MIYEVQERWPSILVTTVRRTPNQSSASCNKTNSPRGARPWPPFAARFRLRRIRHTPLPEGRGGEAQPFTAPRAPTAPRPALYFAVSKSVCWRTSQSRCIPAFSFSREKQMEASSELQPSRRRAPQDTFEAAPSRRNPMVASGRTRPLCAQHSGLW